MPQRSVQQRAGFRGEAFVDKAVSDAGHVWNDTKRDFAIDGQIEFVDADREVTGVAVLAQVKGTEVGFRGETATEFKFTCKADHIAYWLRLGRPVVLISRRHADARGPRHRRRVEPDALRHRPVAFGGAGEAGWITPGRGHPGVPGGSAEVDDELWAAVQPLPPRRPTTVAAAVSTKDAASSWPVQRGRR
ncbi:DUF4365 domain-containing protein [Streptomyces mirabilis]|uniref:DUF4365 domain-containing protein n=1 Tax=Streptomyces mirabilis TaxID=68239 RepID=UPI0036AD676C